MNFEDIRKYWDDRARADPSAQSTTDDFYLREIEHQVLLERIAKFNAQRVADVGCGDGRTTARLATELPAVLFEGYDYSEAMIRNARTGIQGAKRDNLQFAQGDIVNGLVNSFDLIYTTRCLINLPSWDLQARAIDNIRGALRENGIYVMIENHEEGQQRFNEVRSQFGLPEIPIRTHNLFFQRERLRSHLLGIFEIEEDVNISSTYYLVSRIIYSRICADSQKATDYFDIHHQLAAALPFAGEFGPVRLMCLRKIQK